MTKRKRGCLIALILALFLAAAVAVALALLVPGEIRFGGRAPATAAPASAPTPAQSGTGNAAVPANPPAPPPPAPSGWVTYFVPGDILQSEVRKAFPIPLNVVDLVKLRLDNPTFVPDADGTFLRVQLAVEARVLEGDQRLPGTAVIRTRLGYDRAARRVMLRQAQLVELRFSGGAATAASALQPVLASALAAELEGYVIFEVPADGLWWLKAGVGFVRDVYVKDGQVAIGLGP